MAKKKKDHHYGAKLATLIGAFALGAYFFYGKKGIENRKKFEGWALKMKGEILEKLEQLQDVDQEIYNDIVDKVADRYSKMKSVDEKEAEKLAKRMKQQWKKAYVHMAPLKKHAKQNLKKTTKKKASKKKTTKKKTSKKKK